MADTTNYGTVTGRFLAPGDDTPMTGTLRFTPSVPVLVPSVPATRLPARVEAQLDADGDVSFDGQKGCPLFPSDGGIPSGFKWHVEFTGMRYAGHLVRYEGFDFLLGSGQTRDLTLIAEAATLPEDPDQPPVQPAPGGGGTEHYRDGSVWTVAHTLGRKPGVQIYVDNQPVLISYYATDTVVVVSFPSPRSGSIVLT